MPTSLKTPPWPGCYFQVLRLVGFDENLPQNDKDERSDRLRCHHARLFWWFYAHESTLCNANRSVYRYLHHVESKATDKTTILLFNRCWNKERRLYSNVNHSIPSYYCQTQWKNIVLGGLNTLHVEKLFKVCEQESWQSSIDLEDSFAIQCKISARTLDNFQERRRVDLPGTAVRSWRYCKYPTGILDLKDLFDLCCWTRIVS